MQAKGKTSLRLLEIKGYQKYRLRGGQEKVVRAGLLGSDTVNHPWDICEWLYSGYNKGLYLFCLKYLAVPF